MTRSLFALGVAGVLMRSAFAGAATLTLNGGGAVLPQATYLDEFGLFTQSQPSTAFAYGAGNGIEAFLMNDIGLLSGTGFSGTTVFFGASDLSLTASELTDPAHGGYMLSSSDGPVIQIPMIGIATALPYLNAGLKSFSVSDSQLCGIFSAEITNWNQLSAKATAGTIQVFYLTAPSELTLMLTQRLSATCTTANSDFPAYPVPVTTTFAGVFGGGSLPANFHGESSTAAMAAAMVQTPLSFGYLSPDFTSIAPKSPNTTSLAAAALINSENGVAYTPTVQNIELGLMNPGPGSVNTQPPSSQTAAEDPLNWVPGIGLTTKGYSLVGYTNWLLSSCYANVTAGKDLIAFLNDHLKKQGYETAVTNNGFAPIATASPAYAKAIEAVFLSNSSGYGLTIDNATLCAGLPGR